MFLLLGAMPTLAQSWTVPPEETPDLPIVAPGPDSPKGDSLTMLIVDRCEVGYDGCLASDAGWSAPSSWSHVTCRTELSADGSRVLVLAEFRGGVDAAGWAKWPASFPETIACTREIGGFLRTYVVDLTDAPDANLWYSVRFETPTDPSVASMTAGRTITIDNRWIGKAVAINLPDADYLGSEDITWAVDSSGAPRPGVVCGMRLGLDDDWLSVVVMYGVAPPGTAYCVLEEGGVTHQFPITVVVN